MLISGSSVLILGHLSKEISPYTTLVSIAIVCAMLCAFVLLQFAKRNTAETR
jgi:hypothetical protein